MLVNVYSLSSGETKAGEFRVLEFQSNLATHGDPVFKMTIIMVYRKQENNCMSMLNCLLPLQIYNRIAFDI